MNVLESWLADNKEVAPKEVTALVEKELFSRRMRSEKKAQANKRKTKEDGVSSFMGMAKAISESRRKSALK